MADVCEYNRSFRPFLDLLANHASKGCLHRYGCNYFRCLALVNVRYPDCLQNAKPIYALPLLFHNFLLSGQQHSIYLLLLPSEQQLWFVPFIRHHIGFPVSISHLEQLLENSHRVVRTLHTMTRCTTILVYFIIVPALVGLVTKEVDSREFNSTDRLFGLEML